MLKISLYIVLVSLVLITILFFYLMSQGLMKKITVMEKKLGPYYFIYEEHQGDYAKLGKVFMRVVKSIHEADLPFQNIAGAYLTDPRTVKNKDEYRAEAGVLVSEADYKSKNYPQDLKKKILPEHLYVMVEFPTKYNPAGFMIAMMRVYGSLHKHIAKNNYQVTGACLEIYGKDMPPKKDALTLYAFPVKKKEQ